MPKLTLTWRIKDAGACEICKMLDGNHWTYELGTDTFPDTLNDPYTGRIVWDTTKGSEAHAHHKNTCRCNITREFDLSDILAKTERLYKEVQTAAGAT